jgi:hypothetical protein
MHICFLVNLSNFTSMMYFIAKVVLVFCLLAKSYSFLSRPTVKIGAWTSYSDSRIERANLAQVSKSQLKALSSPTIESLDSISSNYLQGTELSGGDALTESFGNVPDIFASPLGLIVPISAGLLLAFLIGFGISSWAKGRE